jgi:hypothetical protein
MQLHDDDCQAAEDTFLYLSLDGPGIPGPFFFFYRFLCSGQKQRCDI